MSAGERSPELLERRVRAIRGRMTSLTHELDLRRREALDWRLQLERHGVALAVVLGCAFIALGVGLGLSARRKARRNRPLARARRLRQALRRAIADPDAVASPSPDVPHRILAAAGSAAATTLTRRLLARALR